MKTISLELSKRLAPYLENINTNKYYSLLKGKKISYYISSLGMFNKEMGDIKTLTLEEAIDFILNLGFSIEFKKYNTGNIFINGQFYGKTQLQAIERLLEYLLDKNLITK